jgi:hypothetical protein
LQVDPEEVKTLLQQQTMPYELADALIRQIDGATIESLPEEEVSLLGELHLVERPAGSDARPTPSVDEMPHASTPDPASVTPIPSVVGGSCSVDHLADEPAALADVALPRNETVVSNITDEEFDSLLMSDIFDAVPSSFDEEPFDEDSSPLLPVLRPHWSGKRARRAVRSLNRRIKSMSLSLKPRSAVVEIPDALIAQYSREGQTKTAGPKTAEEAAATTRSKKSRAKAKKPEGEDSSDDERSNKKGGEGGGGGDGSDGDDGSDPSSSDDEDEDEVDEDSWGNAGSESDDNPEDEKCKKYSAGGWTIKNNMAKGICRGFRTFCKMQPKDACRLVCKFRIFTLSDLAAYHRLDWDNTFKVWGDKQRDAKGKNFRIFFNPIQQERIKVFAWVCHYWERLGWPTYLTKLGSTLGRCFHPAMLQESHYEEAKAQMDRERNNSLSRKDDEEFPGLPTWATMKKQDVGVLHKEIITYCKEHYDAESGMCLGWIVRDNIYAPEWEDRLSLKSQHSHDRPKFFNFAATDELTTQMAPIVP